MRCFAQDLTAKATASLTKVSRQTINKLFDKIRRRIFQLSQQLQAEFGEFEADESFKDD